MFDKKKYDKTKPRSGFTLIELLVFVGIFTLIIGSFIAILVSIINIQTQQVAISEAEQQGQFLVQQLQYYIQGARLADMTADTATSSLVLRESNPSVDPTTFTLSSGTVYLQQGVSGALQALTSNKVVVSGISFTRHYNASASSTPAGSDSVSYSFTVTAGTGPNQSSQLFRSSAPVLVPVNKIALTQQAKGESNNASVSSIVTNYATANNSGDLLLAVVANKGLVTSTISDTNSNSWVMVGSTTYASYSEKLTLYMVTSSVAGANTTTVSFGSGASYASVFLYEYRGATASSPWDTWGGQIQANTASPVSPTVNPTSSVELLFGINYNANTTEVPSPGAGYILETSSTVNNTTQVFVEDMNQYVSGPVSAGWQYSGTPSSTAMIATFK